jgi:hypothetical protein
MGVEIHNVTAGDRTRPITMKLSAKWSIDDRRALGGQEVYLPQLSCCRVGVDPLVPPRLGY